MDEAGRQVADWVADDFGVDLTTVERVDLGADESAELWRGVADDGSRWAVKLSGGGTPAGLVASAYLAGRGVPGIAAPLATDDGVAWRIRGGRRLSVVPWVSDRRALDGGMEPAHWRAFGEVLAAVHATEVGDDLARLLPVEDHAHRPVAAAVRRTGQLVAGPAGAADEVAHDAAREWRDAADLVAALLAEADVLGAELRARAVGPVVCHGDPHLGNLMLGAGGRVWLIDWDDAVLAPRERDLMFVTVGVLAFAPVTPVERAAFFAGYGPVDPDPVRLAYHLTVRALDDFSSWAAQALDPGYDDAERAFALRIVRGLRCPVGLVTLAAAALRDLGRLNPSAAG
ncbi:aminoglycoside phosphotransferase family protein [Micromonospora sp. CPCC 205711]|uniref:aminoglycoside phosphotransferase family protein n=1 Tax=Micromonospora sp. CPCC 205547 TaxID=3122400 RepID=UPI002FF04FDA